MNRDSFSIIVVFKPLFIQHNQRAIPITQRTPAIIVIVPEPAHPGRRPVIAGQPVPSIMIIPLPPTVIVGEPSPGIVGIPDVSVKWMPYPSAVPVRSPGVCDIIRHPDIGGIGGFVDPSA
jgi:hypothetical protein